MNLPGLVEKILWFATIGATAVLLLSIWREGLLGKYKWFVSYLGVRLAKSICLLFVPFKSDAYAKTYYGFEILIWILYTPVLLELYRLVLEQHPGIAQAGRKLVQYGIGIALLVSMITLPLDLKKPKHDYVLLHLFSVVERNVALVVVVLLLLIVAFFFYFPVRMNPNVIAYTVGYFFYFLTTTFVLFTRNLMGVAAIRTASLAGIIVGLACFVYWIIAIRRKNEALVPRAVAVWRPQDQKVMVAHLDALNASLLHMARK